MSKWGLIGLAWGDVMASLEVAKKKNIRKIIYVGPYSNIATFIAEQDFIDEVEFRTYDFDKRYDFMKYFCRMANQDYVSDQINYIYNLFKLQSVCNLEDIESCQCDWSATVDVIEMPEDLKVPLSSIAAVMCLKCSRALVLSAKSISISGIIYLIPWLLVELVQCLLAVF